MPAKINIQKQLLTALKLHYKDIEVQLTHDDYYRRLTKDVGFHTLSEKDRKSVTSALRQTVHTVTGLGIDDIERGVIGLHQTSFVKYHCTTDSDLYDIFHTFNLDELLEQVDNYAAG